MKVIGAGFGRTGTDSIRHALQRLLGGPCYHMKELVTRRDQVWRWMRFVESGRTEMDWEALLEGYVASVDWPVANYWAELTEVFPDAKVLLSVRDPHKWFESFQTLVRILAAIRRLRFVPSLDAMTRLHDVAVWHEFGDLRSEAQCVEVFERHNQRVIDAVPPDRLLVFRVTDGWEPLCDFLDVPVPDEPFPHVNTRGELQRLATREVAKEILRAPLDLLQGGPGAEPAP